MKYVLMILCASLFSVLASAGTHVTGVDENPGGQATYASDGTAAISPAPCNCNKNGEPDLAQADPPSQQIHPAAAAPATGGKTGPGTNAERKKTGG